MSDLIRPILDELIQDCYLLEGSIKCPNSAYKWAIFQIQQLWHPIGIIPQSINTDVTKSYDSLNPKKVGRPPRANLTIAGKTVIGEVKIPGINKIYTVVKKTEGGSL